MSAKILTTSELEGSEVLDAQGREIGTIDSIMIDAGAGQVAYVVLRSNGVLGFGQERFAVPFSVLDFDTQLGQFVSELDEDRLEKAPRYDAEAAAPISDYETLEDIYVFYGVDRYWEARRETESTPSPSHPAAVPSS